MLVIQGVILGNKKSSKHLRAIFYSTTQFAIPWHYLLTEQSKYSSLWQTYKKCFGKQSFWYYIISSSFNIWVLSCYPSLESIFWKQTNVDLLKLLSCCHCHRICQTHGTWKCLYNCIFIHVFIIKILEDPVVNWTVQ